MRSRCRRCDGSGPPPTAVTRSKPARVCEFIERVGDTIEFARSVA